ncbi:MAG TPA: class I SAM-dependent methyltransferase [Gemmata sp.]
MHPTSEVVLRCLHAVRGSSVLLVGSPDPGFGATLAARLGARRVTDFATDFAVHALTLGELARAGGPVAPQFGSWYAPPDAPHDGAIVFLPKSRALIEMTFTMVAGAVAPGGSVLLVGGNSAGIRSSLEPLERIVGEVTFSDSARRCCAYLARRSAARPPRPHLDDWVDEHAPVVRGEALPVATLPGVFSHGRLDDGTRLMLENLPAFPAAPRVLDLGCGCGIVGLAVKRFHPDATVDMTDVSAHALEAARRTVARNGLSGVTVFPSDVFSAVNGRYTRILFNPPFHNGVKTDYRVVEGFFRGAAAHLEPGGEAVVVANRSLPYLPLIEQHLGTPQILAEDTRYRVFHMG